jgi:hypothetical protein
MNVKKYDVGIRTGVNWFRENYFSSERAYVVFLVQQKLDIYSPVE